MLTKILKYTAIGLLVPMFAAATIFPNQGGTGSTTLTGILKGNGTGIVQTAIPGTDYITSNLVTSVFSRVGAVTAQSGDYTTTQVTEGANLYYTQTRFDNALTATTSLPKLTDLGGLLRSTTTNATTTNLFSSILTATQSFFTNLFVTGSSTLQDVTMRNASSTQATTTYQYAQTMNANIANINNLIASASSTLIAANMVNSTTTAATTTQAYIQYLTALNATLTNALISYSTTTAATTTNLYGQTGVFVTASTTNLNATYAAMVNATSTGIFVACNNNNNVLADCYPGADIGAKTNAAYAALQATGGVIDYLYKSYSFSTTINFNTGNKRILMECDPGGQTVLTYTGAATSTQFNTGGGGVLSGDHMYGWGVSGCTFVGPSNVGNTVGIEAGGVTGAEGFTMSNVKITGFGTGMVWGNNNWSSSAVNSGLVYNGINFQSQCNTNCGEQWRFEHTSFVDGAKTIRGVLGAYCVDLAGDTSINATGNLASVSFTDPIFDDCQLYSGTGNINVNVKGAHFENPGHGPGTLWNNYPYIVQATSSNSFMYLTDSTIMNDATSTIEHAPIPIINGGTISMWGDTVNDNATAFITGQWSALVYNDTSGIGGNSQMNNVCMSSADGVTKPVAALTQTQTQFPVPQVGQCVNNAYSNHNSWLAGDFLSSDNNRTFYAGSIGQVMQQAGIGFGTTTLVGLSITGSATSTSNVGYNITTGCYAIAGVCVSGGGSGASSTLLVDNNTFTGANIFSNVVRSTTTQATTTSLAVTAVKSALHLGDANGTVTAYGGTSCSNQFVRSLNASGAGTCNSVANIDLTNSAITINGTSVSLGGSITVSSTTLLANNNTFSGQNVFTSSTTLQNFTGLQSTTTYSTSTNFYATLSSSTNLFSTNANIGVQTVGNLTVTGTCTGCGAGSSAVGGTGAIQYANGAAFAGNPKHFWDNTNERLAIGTSSPWVRLSVQGAYGLQDALFEIASSTNSNGSATTSMLKVKADGSVRINQSSDTNANIGFFVVASTTNSNSVIGNMAGDAYNKVACGTRLASIAGITGGSTYCGSYLEVDSVAPEYGGFRFSVNGVLKQQIGHIGDNNGISFMVSDGVTGAMHIFDSRNVQIYGSLAVGTSTFDNQGERVAPARLFVQGLNGSLLPLFDVSSSTNSNGSATSSLFTIAANGRVGVGTSSPYAMLSVMNTLGATSTPLGALAPLFVISSSTNGLGTTTTFIVDARGNLTLTGSTTLQNFTGLQATTTQATSTYEFATTASSTNLFSQLGSIGAFTAQTLLVNGSSTLQNFTGLKATTTAATTTNLFSSIASSSNQFSLGATSTTGYFASSLTTFGKFASGIMGYATHAFFYVVQPQSDTTLVADFASSTNSTGSATTTLFAIFRSGGIRQGGASSTIAAGTGAGTSPTLVTINGNGNAGFIQITTGTTPTAAATVATITLPAMTCSKDVYTTITPGNSTTAGLNGTSMVFATSSGSKTSWVITSNSIAILGSTAYAWNYQTNCAAL